MLKSICFIVCFVSLWTGIVLQKKSDKKQLLIVWISISFFLVLSYHAFVAGIMQWFNIPINMWSIFILDLILNCVIWYQIRKRKKIQLFEISWIDWIAVIVIFVVATVGALHQFGYRLDINYLTTDPGAHYRQALTVLKSHEITRMYFSPLNNSLFLGLFEFILRPTRLYRAFILADVILYAMSGLITYALMRERAKTVTLGFTGLILSVIYMLGYPRNNMLFGFVYLGMGISICALLIFLTNQFIEKGEYRNWLTFYLMCGTVSIGICYSLFAPVVFFAICFVVSWCIWKEQKEQWRVACKAIAIRNLMIFLLPCCIILSSNVFALGSFKSDVESSIVLEGFVYRDLFSNFILVLPFAIYGIWKYYRMKKSMGELAILFFVFCVIFTIVLGILGIKGNVSSYYFYKMHYLIAMLLFYLCFIGITELIACAKSLIIICGSLVGILAMVSFSNLEVKIQQQAPNFVPELKSSYFFHIYKFNQEKLQQIKKYPVEKIRLYEVFHDQYDEGDNYIFNGYQEDYSWACGIAQRLDYKKNTSWTMFSDYEISELTRPGAKPAFSEGDEALFRATLNKENMLPIYIKNSDQKPKNGTWIIVMNREIGASDWKKLPYKDNLEVVYENAAGCIAKMRGIE